MGDEKNIGDVRILLIIGILVFILATNVMFYMIGHSNGVSECTRVVKVQEKECKIYNNTIIQKSPPVDVNIKTTEGVIRVHSGEGYGDVEVLR